MRTTSVDIRSDIYSLGCTLYHLLSGQPPFYDSDLRPDKAHERLKVPPIANQKIPKPLWQLLRQSMSKMPHERFETPADFADALMPYCQDNTLVELVDKARKPVGGEPTMQGHATDTYAGSSGRSDTLPADYRTGSTTPSGPAISRRWMIAGGAALAASAVAGVWFATEAARRQADFEQSQLKLVAAQRESFITAARFRASQVATQVDKRFRILETDAEEGRLDAPNEQGQTTQQQLPRYVARVSANPKQEELWQPLQRWIVRRERQQRPGRRLGKLVHRQP